jgi:hypothetical protein
MPACSCRLLRLVQLLLQRILQLLRLLLQVAAALT